MEQLLDFVKRQNWPFFQRHSRCNDPTFGADLQNAKNVPKTTKVLAMYKLMNSRTILFTQKKKNTTTNMQKLTRFWKEEKIAIFQGKNKLIPRNLRLCKENPEHIICIERRKWKKHV